MRKFTGLLALIALLVVGVGPVAAGYGNPHLVSVTGGIANFKTLSVNYKIAGLGNAQNDDFRIAASYAMDYVCQHPTKANFVKTGNNGLPFRTHREDSFSKTVAADFYGQVTDSFTIHLAPPICPGGWTTVLTGIEFDFVRGSHSAAADVMDLVWE